MTERKEWYSPSSIRFTKDQLLWLLPHLDNIRAGDWPPEHKETGYIGKSKSKRKPGAYFEPAVCIGAEVSVRLLACRRDGQMVIARYCWGKNEEELAEYFNLPYDRVIEGINSALRYCTGWKRKRTKYSQWKRNKDYANRNVLRQRDEGKPTH